MKPQTTPKDFFLYIAALVTLYISAGSLIALLFQIIDIKFPDQLDYYYDPYSGAIRFAIASLLIIFPVYLLISWYLNRDIKASPDKRELSIRKWLIFLTIFVAGAIVIGDLVALINIFLGGEITTRFFLKVLAVLVVALFAFFYYGLDLKNRLAGWGKYFALDAIVVVLAAIIFGFVVLGSPLTQRQLRLDERRVGDLQSIQWQIINFWQAKGVIPNDLALLADPLSGFILPSDPETGTNYEYKKMSARAFELCATFDLAGPLNNHTLTTPKPTRSPQPVLREDNWNHQAERQCFSRTIDPDLYPVRKD